MKRTIRSSIPDLTVWDAPGGPVLVQFVGDTFSTTDEKLADRIMAKHIHQLTEITPPATTEGASR